MGVRVRCPVLQVYLPEINDTTAEINGLTNSQVLFVEIRLCQTIHGRVNMG